MLYYVSIAGVTDETLAFLGYDLLYERNGIKVYRHYTGDEHLVDAAEPCLYTEDVNDVMHLRGNVLVIDPSDD